MNIPSQTLLVVRLLGKDLRDAETAYETLIGMLPGGERAASRLLTQAVLGWLNIPFTQELTDRISEFAYQRCRETGISPAYTVAETAWFAATLLTDKPVNPITSDKVREQHDHLFDKVNGRSGTASD